MLSYDPERHCYAPGVRLVRLAHAAWSQSSLAPVARPIVDALSREVGETVHLAQLDHGQVLYVDKRNARQPIEMFSQAGKVGPAYCTGVGKAMLAFLDEAEVEQVLPQQSFHPFTPKTLTSAQALREELARIRARGYAFDDEEHERGIICIAMPILTRSGRVLGALSVTSSTARTTLEGLSALAPSLRRAAVAISEEVATWRFPDETKHAGRTGTG
jgi:DNA-binding IclR family transcriptional regulator